MKKVIKIRIINFGKRLDSIKVFNQRFGFSGYKFVLSEDPDFTIVSDGGSAKTVPVIRDSTVKIFIASETKPFDVSTFDYSFCCRYLKSEKNFRIPTYVFRWFQLGHDPVELIKNNFKATDEHKRKFCCFICSKGVPFRERFFKRLSRYKRVDSVGLRLNNVGYHLPLLSNLEVLTNFIRQYKFIITFENESLIGYTSERIAEAMLANTIPIYWGNRWINRDFNTNSFINYHQFTNEDKVIKRIIRLDQDDNLYKQVLERPWFNNNKIPHEADKKILIKRFREIFG